MFKEKIAQCLENLPNSFQKGELAYLALTSKPELHLRDKLAFTIQNSLTNRLVCREWRRHDIAILLHGPSVPDTIVEVKVFYTFDGVVPNKINHMKEAIRADIGKMKRNAPNAERLALLFLVHPGRRIPEALLQAIAFSTRVNQVYTKERYNGPDPVLREAKHTVEAFWKEIGAKWLKSGDFAAGIYQGIEARIVYWLAEV